MRDEDPGLAPGEEPDPGTRAAFRAGVLRQSKAEITARAEPIRTTPDIWPT